MPINLSKFIFFCAVFIFYPLQAQKLAGWGVEPNFCYGKIFVHTSNIRTPILANTIGGEIAIEKKLQGKNPQHAHAKYPEVGILLNYQNFNQRFIGWGLGISPYINMDFFKYKNFRLYGRLALGVGWLSDHYNAANNTYNNIVGSNVSNNTILRLAAGIKINKNWELRPAFHFSHFSNAASQLPNYGINVTSFQLGLLYQPQPYSQTDFIRWDSLPPISKRFLIGVSANLGMRESTTYGGAKYPVYQLSADVSRWISRLHRVKLGFEYEKLNYVQEFLLNTGVYTRQQAQKQASRVSIYGGFEIMWGRFTLGTNIGFYVSRNALQPYFFHFRVLARYYLVNPMRAKIQPYVGWGLKTHKIIAEYMSLNVGVLF